MAEWDNEAEARLCRWMQAAQEGDHAAYVRLLRALLPTIRGTVRRQRGFLSADEIEDLVQDALLSIHAVRATYDPARPFTPWLMAIVRNRLADGGRRHARLRAVDDITQDFYETFQPAATNNQGGDYGDAEELRHAIAELPEGQRQAIELVKMREMSLKEASRETGMSVAALKVAVHRAVKTLRARLKKR